MARKHALSIENLIELGPEKLARLVLDETERNAGFKRQVSAAPIARSDDETGHACANSSRQSNHHHLQLCISSMEHEPGAEISKVAASHSLLHDLLVLPFGHRCHLQLHAGTPRQY